MMKKVGLIAGNGQLPLILGREANKRGYELVVLAIKGETSSLIKNFASSILWVEPGELKKSFSFFLKEGVKEIVMIGQVKHQTIFKKRVDSSLKKILSLLPDKRTNSILGKITEEIEKRGIKVLPSSYFLSCLFPPSGLLTERKISEEERKDIELGRKVGMAIAGADIGQTVVVKNGVVLSVEAIEGTDETIKRAAKFTDGIVVVKVPRPEQDDRFDMPIVGLQTIKVMAENRAKVLALDGRKTLFLDQKKAISLANKEKISIVVEATQE